MMTRIHTPYGDIRAGGPCKDDYRNIATHTTFFGPNHQVKRPVDIKLQEPAWRSFRKVEEILKHQIVVTGTWRSCALQAQLYNSDPHRYADPDVTLHTRGLAIDVSMNDHDFPNIIRLLLNHGWHRVRSDEPWHASFWLTA